jgi:Pyruvate kinase, barrel domain
MAEHLSAAVMGRKLSSILVEEDEDAPCGSKVCCTLGPQSRSVDVLERLLCAGMTVARFDFSWGDDAYHQETLDNLLQVRQGEQAPFALHAPSVGTRGVGAHTRECACLHVPPRSRARDYAASQATRRRKRRVEKVG